MHKNKFPVFPGINTNNLKLDKIGEYSMSTQEISSCLIDILISIKNQYHMKSYDIIETHGGYGGFSIPICTNHKLLEYNDYHIYEIKSDVFELLSDNIYEYIKNDTDMFKKIKLYNNDCMDMKNISNNNTIIISDPPWPMGKLYHKFKRIDLFINNVNIVHIINNLYDQNKFRAYILMCPKNFDICYFIRNIKSKNINIVKTKNHYFAVVYK